MAAKKSANAGLPRVDFDHVIIGHLPSMIASLDPNGLTELITYEREHADRLPFLEVMERRLEALNNGATPSASIAVDLPKGTDGKDGVSKVSPATAGPPLDPAANTVRSNPTQR